MRRVVVDRADDHTSRPRRGRPKRGTLEFSRFVACLEILHFSGIPRVDPIRKVVEFRKIAHGGYACQFKPRLAGGTLYQFR